MKFRYVFYFLMLPIFLIVIFFNKLSVVISIITAAFVVISYVHLCIKKRLRIYKKNDEVEYDFMIDKSSLVEAVANRLGLVVTLTQLFLIFLVVPHVPKVGTEISLDNIFAWLINVAYISVAFLGMLFVFYRIIIESIPEIQENLKFPPKLEDTIRHTEIAERARQDRVRSELILKQRVIFLRGWSRYLGI